METLYYLFSFKGGTGRIAFLGWHLVWAMLSVLMVGLLSSGGAGLSLLLAGACVLTILVNVVAVTVRRLHDIGMSGWWILGLQLPFYAYELMASPITEEGVQWKGFGAFDLLDWSICAYLVFYLFLLYLSSGKQSDNKYC